MLTLSTASHPFKAQAHTVPVPHGLSLTEMLAVAQPDPVLARHAVAFIDGELIPRETWDSVYPDAGDLVEIRVLPTGGGGGGGKDPLRTVLQLAVLVAASTIPGLQAFAALTTFQSSLLQAGITVLGSLAVNALVPVQGPDRAPAEDELFAIQGFQNRARPFEPVPQILGRRRIAPDYGTRPFTEIVGEDQYIRAIFVWGIGPMEIDIPSIKIGETPITEFEGVEMEHRNGTPSDPPRTLYSNTVFQDDLQVRLGGIADGVDETTGPQIRVAPAPADELSIDITFPGGLIGVGKTTGDEFALSVPITVEYREVGSSTWLVPSFTAKSFPDDWIVGNEITITGRRRGVVRHGMTWSVPTNGTYEIKVERLSKAAGQGNNTDETFWTALRAIERKDPISSRVPVATTTVRIKATDQLNGTLDQFNGIVTTRGKDFVGGAWLDNQSIRTPAALFRHVLQGNSNAVAVSDSKIDLASLEAFRAFCVANNFECSSVVRTGRSVWEVLTEVAACGRAAPANIDGKWGVVIDQPQAAPVSHITPRNSANFSAEKSFTELPHAFRIPFINEDEDFRQDEIRVYRDGFSSANATRFEELRLPGVTKPEQVERLGRYRMAQGILQNERWSFRQDMEFLTYNRGDRVKITHDVLLVGLHSGRVKGVTVDGSNNVTAIEVDEVLEMEAGQSYGITIRTPLDASISRGVVTATGGVLTVTLDTPIPAVGGSAAVTRGDLFGFGLLGAETDDAQIVSIRPVSDNEADIVAVPYREAVYDVDSQVVTPPLTTVPPIVPVPVPVVRSIISDERAVSQDGAGGVKIRAIFEVDPIPTISRFTGAVLNVQQRATGTGEPWVNSTIDERANGRVVASGFREGQALEFRLRWVPPAPTDLPGPWTAAVGHTVVGRTFGTGTGPDLSVSAISKDDGSGTARRPAIEATWTEDIPAGVESVVIEVRLAGIASSVVSLLAEARSQRSVIENVLSATAYEVRARYAQGAKIEWSGWVPVTSLSVGDSAGLTMVLSTETITVPADNDGSNPDLSAAQTTITVLNGSADDTANWTLARTNGTGVTSTLTGTTLDVTGLTVDTGHVDITATRAGFPTLGKRLTLSKAKAGAGGNTSVIVFAHLRAASAPATPSGGSYNFGTKILTPPSGWSVAPPATNGDPLWQVSATAKIAGIVGVDSSLSWSSPVKLVEDGAQGSPGTDGTDGVDGADGTDAITFVLSPTSVALPADAAGNVTDYGPSSGVMQVFEGETELNFTTATASTSLTNGSWQIYGASRFPVGFITVGSRSDSGLSASINPASAMDVSVDGGTITYLVRVQRANGVQEEFQVRQAISKAKAGADGADGADGAPGADGATGDTQVTGRVYFQTLQGTAPSAPTATGYDSGTGQLTGLTAGWSQAQPPVEVTDTTVQEWSAPFTVTIDGVTSAVTVSFGAVTGAIQINSDIQSDNFVAGTSGWQIKRDTGEAEFGAASIRGKLTASQVEIDGITLQANGSDELEIAGTIQSDNFVAGTSGWQINRATGAAEFDAATIRGLLQADQIKIDNVTLDTDAAGTLLIANSGVGTAQIGANAVTKIQYDQKDTTTTIGTTGTAWTTTFTTNFSVTDEGDLLVRTGFTLRTAGADPLVATSAWIKAQYKIEADIPGSATYTRNFSEVFMRVGDVRRFTHNIPLAQTLSRSAGTLTVRVMARLNDESAGAMALQVTDEEIELIEGKR